MPAGTIRGFSRYGVITKYGAVVILSLTYGCGYAGASAEAKECVGKTDAPLVRLLPPPPCENCEETKAELSELLELQKSSKPRAIETCGG